MRRAWIAAVLVAAVGVAAGCGGSDDETDPTAAWAGDFCSAVSAWQDELESITSQFSDLSNLNEDALRTAAEDAESATQTFVDELQSLGAPETESGEEVKSSIDDLTSTLDTEVAEIRSTVDGVSGLADVPGAISTISTSLSALSTAFSQTLQTIESADAGDELETALEDSPECDSLTT
jgi:hypothetical protein